MKLIRWILALIFAGAAGLKIAAAQGVTAHPAAGVATMFSALPVWAQWTLITAELLLAIWLVTNYHPRWSTFATIVLLSTFLGAILVEMGKTNPHSCGCLGTLAPASPLQALWMSLTLDVILLAGALWLYYGCTRIKSDKNSGFPIDLGGKE